MFGDPQSAAVTLAGFCIWGSSISSSRCQCNADPVHERSKRINIEGSRPGSDSYGSKNVRGGNVVTIETMKGFRFALGAVIVSNSILIGQEIKFNQVVQPTIEARLRSYTTRNKERLPALRRIFEDAGCMGDALTEQRVKGVKAPNLICTYKGESDSIIVIGAHFDLDEKGSGVADNWTGASLLPSLFQSLANLKMKHTFIFVAFTGEEIGLLGSKSYVKQMGEDLTKIKGMVNLDTLGLSDTKIWTTNADKKMLGLLAALAKAMDLPVAAMNVDNVGSSDSEPFRNKGVPALTLHSITQENWNILHTVKDTIKQIKMDEYYRSYRLIAAYMALLDRELE